MPLRPEDHITLNVDSDGEEFTVHLDEDLKKYLQYFEARKFSYEACLRLGYEDDGDYSREELHLFNKLIIEAAKLADECRQRTEQRILSRGE